MVEYYPMSARNQSRLHQFGKVLPGIFLGYALSAGGFWKEDILVADIEEVKKTWIRQKSILKESMQKKC